MKIANRDAGSVGRFAVLIGVFYLAQLIMVTPGSDVSPHAYASGGVSGQVYLLGMSPSALCAAAIFVFCVFSLLLRGRVVVARADVVLMLLIAAFALLAVAVTRALGPLFDYLSKLLLPFLVFFYLRARREGASFERLSRLILGVHLLTVGQVFACKLATGRFAANTYYQELSEEYFGFYHHPHAFAGLAGLLLVWSLYQIGRRKRGSLHLLLCLLDGWLLYRCKVRTYLLAAGIGVAALFFFSFFDRRITALRRWAVPAGVALLLLAPRVFSGRVTGDFSSGRFARWTENLRQFLFRTGVLEKLFGSGVQASWRWNEMLFGVYVNSLNGFLDLLIDHGIVGLIVFLSLWACVWKQVFARGNKSAGLALLSYTFVGVFITSLLAYVTTTLMLVLILCALLAEEADEDSRAQPAPVPHHT